jgi:tetratricopeptide (TPR) repeat protein
MNHQDQMEPSEDENELLHMLAQALSQGVEKGLELLEQELLRQPHNWQLHYHKSVFLIGFQRRYEEGLKAIDQALQMDWQGKQSLYEQLLYYKGQALQGLERYEEALQMYDQALEVKEDNVTFYAKGKTLCQLRRYEEALQAAEESLAILELADTWSLKGQALAGLRRYKAAITAYEKALHLDPQNEEASNGKKEALRALSSLSPRNKPEKNK